MDVMAEHVNKPYSRFNPPNWPISNFVTAFNRRSLRAIEYEYEIDGDFGEFSELFEENVQAATGLWIAHPGF